MMTVGGEHFDKSSYGTGGVFFQVPTLGAFGYRFDMGAAYAAFRGWHKVKSGGEVHELALEY